MGCHFLLQRVFPTQELNPGLLHCKQILYYLSYREVSLQCILNTATGATLLFCSKLCRAFSSQSKSTNLQNNLKSLMRSDLPLVISLILTPITSSCAQHTQETLASFSFPECSRHMLLPWNIYHAAPFLKNMFLSHISTYLFSHLFQVLVICFHLDLSVSY